MPRGQSRPRWQEQLSWPLAPRPQTGRGKHGPPAGQAGSPESLPAVGERRGPRSRNLRPAGPPRGQRKEAPPRPGPSSGCTEAGMRATADQLRCVRGGGGVGAGVGKLGCRSAMRCLAAGAWEWGRGPRVASEGLGTPALQLGSKPAHHGQPRPPCGGTRRHAGSSPSGFVFQTERPGSVRFPLMCCLLYFFVVVVFTLF